MYQSEKAFLMEIGTGDCFAKSYTVDVQDYQNLKDIEDRATDVLLCLESTLDKCHRHQRHVSPCNSSSRRIAQPIIARRRSNTVPAGRKGKGCSIFAKEGRSTVIESAEYASTGMLPTLISQRKIA
jgi:hypothetical protein